MLVVTIAFSYISHANISPLKPHSFNISNILLLNHRTALLYGLFPPVDLDQACKKKCGAIYRKHTCQIRAEPSHCTMYSSGRKSIAFSYLSHDDHECPKAWLAQRSVNVTRNLDALANVVDYKLGH